MKKKVFAHSAFFVPRLFFTLLLFAAACFISARTLPAFFRSEGVANNSHRTLTFAERVAYQRAIEDVYWRHRIWPRERPDPKPPLDAVISQAQLEQKVTDYLRKSQALDDYWQRPINAEQLQAEMDRMAKHTRQPDVLRELFEALGNDPFIIAECLARPALTDRLLTNWYAYDERIHGELKRRAEAELHAHNTVEQMKQLSGKYSEIQFIKSNCSHGGLHQRARDVVRLDGREWEQQIQRLSTIFGDPAVPAAVPGAKPTGLEQIKVGTVSRVQEDDTYYYATAVIKKSDGHIKLGTTSWLKKSLESWLNGTENQTSKNLVAPTASYTLPAIVEGSCTDDTWTPTAGPPDGRDGVTAAWTGSEMIVWGGWLGGEYYVGTGGRYDPSIDTWTPTNNSDAPASRSYHTAVWTGNEMIIWGGFNFNDGYLNTGGRYNPITDSWVPTTTINAPAGREFHTAVWTGNEMIVWGGSDSSNNMYFNTGGKYNSDTDTWVATSTTNAPVGRYGHTAVWTGNEMIVWGGLDQNIFELNSGGRYNAATNSWTATTTANAPAGRDAHRAVWTGTDMIVWGGFGGNNNLNSGGRYNPVANSWTATSTSNTPSARGGHAAVWTGTEMIVWGGVDFLNSFNTGGRYNPTTNSWTATSTTNAPPGRSAPAAVWTGTEMIVWGGNVTGGGRYNPSIDSWIIPSAPGGRSKNTAIWTGAELIIWGGTSGAYTHLSTGVRYDPATNNWTPTSDTNTPVGREFHTAVWTGSEMVVWGGWDESTPFNSGGRYNPATNGWTATSTTNAPVGRFAHTSVWAGSEMIVWGGEDNNFLLLNSGGRYNPNTNSWMPTSTMNTPTGRHSHSAVWSGSEMIIWGGYDNDFSNTGGRYNPVLDNWTATTTMNAPTGRLRHSAVWSGSEIIIWGGFDYNIIGGRYNPITDSWTATSPTNAPQGRESQAAIWTGSEMVVWGGYFNDGLDHYLNTGGRYDPSGNSWTTTSITNAPARRSDHTAVWTGSEMIVWGGGLSTGGRYCAQSDPTPTPTPTPTPCTGRCTPTPRPRPSPAPRPTL